MPLIPDGSAIRPETLHALLEELRTDLTGLLEDIAHPRAPVIDPASLRTAEELVRAALARIERSRDADPHGQAADVNLAYATMLAAIDLLKSHTDGPRVPRHRVDPGA